MANETKFTKDESKAIRQAIETHVKTLERRINAEKNDNIKLILQEDLQRYNNLHTHQLFKE